ncbi:MAG: AraC family transcriptional regulator [Bacteroidota bacterium]
MDIIIRASGFEPFPITSEIPAGLAEYHIPGSKVMSAVAPFGNLMLQLVELDGFNWLYSVFHIEEDVTFLIRSFMPLVLSRIILNGDFDYEIRSVAAFKLKESQFNIFYLTELNNSLFLKKGVHVSLEIIYSQNFLLQTLDFFPVFAEFKTNVLRSVPSLLSEKELYATASMMDAMYKIIHSPYSSNVRQFHLDIIKDLLFQMLQQASEQHTCNKKFTISEVERIHAAKEFIDSNVPQHYSIFQIARRVGINDQKLKKGFKEIIGTGLYGYLQDRILEIAKIEIEQTTRSIKEIALHAGYKNANNFSAAFKKKLGLTPLDWRKQSNEK